MTLFRGRTEYEPRRKDYEYGTKKLAELHGCKTLVSDRASQLDAQCAGSALENRTTNIRELIEALKDGENGIADEWTGIRAESSLTIGNQYLRLTVFPGVEQKLSRPRSARRILLG
jgi:hypothetical protein